MRMNLPSAGTCCVVAAALSPGVALAEDPLLVNNVAACTYMTPSDGNQVQRILQADVDHMLLFSDGLLTVDYNCRFETDIEFDWSIGEVQIRSGYCEEPGPIFEPEMFTFWFWEHAGQLAISVDTLSREETLEFYLCR